MNVQTPADNFMVAPGMHARRSSLDNPIPRRLPGTGWLPVATKNHVIGMLGEFTGTFLFLFFAFAATQVANMAAADNPLPNAGPDLSVLLYMSLAFGFSLAVNAWVFFRISGGLFNPAVSALFQSPFLIGKLTSRPGRSPSDSLSSEPSAGFARCSLSSLRCWVPSRLRALSPLSSQARCSSEPRSAPTLPLRSNRASSSRCS